MSTKIKQAIIQAIRTAVVVCVAWVAHTAALWAQSSPLLRGVEYEVQSTITAGSGAAAPFWLTSNRYGSASFSPTSGTLRIGAERSLRNDSTRKWQFGYGITLNSATQHSSRLYLQQAYLQAQWQQLRLTFGQKETDSELKDAALSTGAQSLGINARPIPALRFDLSDWWNISGSADFAALKGHLAFGWMTDGTWRKNYVAAQAAYTTGILHHQKAGYLRLGNPKRHSLSFVGGLEWGTSFGGNIYNASGFDGQHSLIKGKAGVADFVAALAGIRTGDPTDGDGYANTAGNTVGSWVASLQYTPPSKSWRVRLYYDHFFDDHSMMFDEYGWYDAMYGVELHFPHFRPLSCLVFEHLNTRYQSGAVYHDRTAALPVQISGVDNYYNHALYQGWHNYGMALGNPLFTSPLYENDGTLSFASNRFHAYHLGLQGGLISGLDYRFLLTHLRSWGSYHRPFPEVQKQTSLLCELRYRPAISLFRTAPAWTRHWELTLAFALDRGERLGRQQALSLSLRKTGALF